MLIYRILITLLAPLLAVALAMRVLAKKETMGDLRERLGLWKRLPNGKVIWIHGASNGELRAAQTLIQALGARHAGTTILITCNTTTARRMVRDWGLSRVDARLAPLDLRWIYSRMAARMNLRQFILLEADFWPNRILTVKRKGIATALVAGRLSRKSAGGWARFSAISKAMFGAFDLICAQDDASEKSLLALGARPGAIGTQITLKSFYHADTVPLPHAQRREVWLAASTHEGEDEILLNAHLEARKTIPNLRLILAPRHPKRAPHIARLAQGLGLRIALRSEGAQLDDPCDIFLADTLGEMDLWYRAAGVCFVAGSLVAKGGHTPFEPAFHECALLHGAHLENFAQPYADLAKCGGAQLCTNKHEIAQALLALTHQDAASAQRANAHTALAQTDQDLGAVLNALDQLSKP